MQIDQKALKTLGLTEREAEVFFAINKKVNTVKLLVQKMGVPATDTKGALQGLISKKFVTQHGNKLHAVSNTVLREYAQQQLNGLHNIVEKLTKEVLDIEDQFGLPREQVQLFSGKEGIFKAMLEEARHVSSNNIETKKIKWQEITDLDAMHGVLSDFDLIPMRQSLRSKMLAGRGVYAGKIASKKLQLAKAERYVLAKRHGGFRCNITNFKDTSMIVTFEKRPLSIIIRNKAIVKTLDVLLDIAFENSKKVD